MSDELRFEVIPETVQERLDVLHGICGEYRGKPVMFMFDTASQGIIIPESMEPVYPEIEAAVKRCLRSTGRMK